MEHPNKKPGEQPTEHHDLCDPKLPTIRGEAVGNRAQSHINPAPIPNNQREL